MERNSDKAVKAEQGSILTASRSEDKIVSTLVKQDADSKLRHKYHISTNIIGWKDHIKFVLLNLFGLKLIKDWIR